MEEGPLGKTKQEKIDFSPQQVCPRCEVRFLLLEALAGNEISGERERESGGVGKMGRGGEKSGGEDSRDENGTERENKGTNQRTAGKKKTGGKMAYERLI